MNEVTTSLPPIEEIRKQNTMRIITIDSSRYLCETKKTALDVVDIDGQIKSVYAKIIAIDDPRVNQFMPSKVVWNDKSEAFDVIFYVADSLPKAVRPFEGNTYLMYFYPNYGDEVHYDVTMRLFIDQVKTPHGLAMIVMFGDEVYNHVTLTPKKDVIV